MLNIKAAALALLAGTVIASTQPALAQSVLRIDEVPVGELDPAKSQDIADTILLFNVYDTLVAPRQGAPGVEPHLAESWTVEGNAYTFTLRPDVKFTSGNPLTAADVVFSLERMRTLAAGQSYLFGSVEGVEAVDDRTVRITLSRPYAPFVAALTRLGILDSKLVKENLGDGDGEMKDWGQGFLSANSAGSGAYRVVSHNPQEETVMEKNAGYFLGVPEKAPDSVRLRYGLEAATVRTLIARGEHDISSQWLPPEVLKSLAAEGAQLLTESGTGAFYIKMNTTKAPLDDVNCRLAISKAFDYEAALKMVALTDTVALGKPSTGVLPVGMLGSFPADRALKRDMDAARKHLAECKYKPEDFTLELSWIGEVALEERFALLMQANFTELGFKSEIVKLPWAMFVDRVTKPENTPHFSQLFTDATTGDPDTLVYQMYHSSVPGTFYSPEYLNDAEVDALLDQGRAEVDEAKRAEIYTTLNQRLLDLAPTIFVYDRQTVFAGSTRVDVPALSDRSKAFGVPTYGLVFRLIEMKE
ncbi:MAG: ABC transporter substrate-binding protein [Rhizobiaceae bacterium]